MTSFLRTVIKPCDCTLAFGIPVTDDDTHVSVVERYRGDVRRFINQPGRPFDRNEYKAHIPDKHISAYEHLGVDLVREISRASLAPLLAKATKVLVLFSHWHEGAIEVCDDFIRVDEFLSALPRAGPQRIYDFSICNPDNLALSVKKQRPDCFIRYSSAEIDVRGWFDVLLVLFRLLDESDLTYAEAWELVAGHVGHPKGELT